MGGRGAERGNTGVLDGGRCFIIGEVAQAHDGSLGMAHAFIDAIASAGADAVKFQTHIADAESTPAEPWRVPFSTQDASRYDYWRRMEFTQEAWHGLRTHADDRGLAFLSSPFSVEAVELLERIGVAAWKIASGQVADPPTLARLLKSRLPVLLSTGMSDWAEIDAVVSRIHGAGAPLALLQCTTEYPCPPERIGLNLIPEFRARYGCAVGLSDHSGTIYPSLAAATDGIDVLEVHVTLSREMFGPDVVASVTTAELRQIVEGVRFIEAMRSNPVDKDAMAAETESLRRLFSKSVVARIPLLAGTVLDHDHVAVKKPGHGIPAVDLADTLGRRLRLDVSANEVITEDHLHPKE
jgi:N,N'-diacetyllegionaminate synthase